MIAIKNILSIKAIFFVLIFVLTSCHKKIQNRTTEKYTTILDGVYVEQFDSTSNASDRYTIDNKIYKGGNKYTYDFYYEDLTKKKYVFKEVEGASGLPFLERVKAWVLVPIDNIDSRTINQINLTIKHDLKQKPTRASNYSQTVIAYDYPQKNGEQKFNESTGLIENPKNVWMHPPRKKLFRILELNPFPFIQAPYKVGKKWSWSLKIGSFWGDKRWKTWEKSITNEYEYEITAIKKIDSKIGLLKCYEIKSIANSELGQTMLTAYFNMKHGFVKLDYINIDSTQIVFELVLTK